MRNSLALLAPMGEIANLTGDPVRGAGWYGPNTGLHSVAVRVLNFQGRVAIEASLALIPDTDDWFSVLPDDAPHWQYPLGMLAPFQTGETSALGFNFVCNVIWVRARVDRSYLVTETTTPVEISRLGIVDSILLNY